MTQHTLPAATISEARPNALSDRVVLALVEYSESSFTDPHSVVSLDEPAFDEQAYSHIGKIYEGVEPYRMGGHWVSQDEQNALACTHHYDPNHREHFIVQLQHRTLLRTLCISTRFFAGNPASNLTVTIIDDLHNKERTIPIALLRPDAEHWLDAIDAHATRIAFHFKAGGITRIWAYGARSEQQPAALTWLSKNSTVLFAEDDFFGGPNFALSEQADRSNNHMLGWETSRSAMGLKAVFPITKGTVAELIIDTYRHVNNYLRSAWVFSAVLPENEHPQLENSPLWLVTSSEGAQHSTADLRAFFAEQHQNRDSLATYNIAPAPNEVWQLQSTFKLSQDAMHRQSGLHFKATHICIMLLPHGGLHAMKVMGVAEV